eukprot:4139327-Pyramimonas_sp.AAC.1
MSASWEPMDFEDLNCERRGYEKYEQVYTDSPPVIVQHHQAGQHDVDLRAQPPPAGGGVARYRQRPRARGHRCGPSL